LGGAATRLAALPANGLPNGLAMDRATDTLYASDSVLGVIWRVKTSGGKPAVWARGAALEPDGFLGANGLKLHNGAVWTTNLDKGTVLRIPMLATGSAGNIQVKSRGEVPVLRTGPLLRSL